MFLCTKQYIARLRRRAAPKLLHSNFRRLLLAISRRFGAMKQHMFVYIRAYMRGFTGRALY